MYTKFLPELCTRGFYPSFVPGNPPVFPILFTFVTKLRKLVRWFDDINEEKKQIASDAISIVEVQGVL